MSETSALPLFDAAIATGVTPQSLKPIIKPAKGNYVAVIDRLNCKAGEFKFKDASGVEQVVPCHRVWFGYVIPNGIGDDGVPVSWPGEIATILSPQHLAQVPISERWKGNGLPGDVWPARDGKPEAPKLGAFNRLLGNVSAALGLSADVVAQDFNGALAQLQGAIAAGLTVNLYVDNRPNKKGGEPYVHEFVQSVVS